MSESFGDNFVAFAWVMLGVLISVLLPPLSAYVRNQFRPTAAAINVKKYVGLFLFSAITALIALAIYRSQNSSTHIQWYAALLAGYTWETLFEKFASSSS